MDRQRRICARNSSVVQSHVSAPLTPGLGAGRACRRSAATPRATSPSSRSSAARPRGRRAAPGNRAGRRGSRATTSCAGASARCFGAGSARGVVAARTRRRASRDATIRSSWRRSWAGELARDDQLRREPVGVGSSPSCAGSDRPPRRASVATARTRASCSVSVAPPKRSAVERLVDEVLEHAARALDQPLRAPSRRACGRSRRGPCPSGRVATLASRPPSRHGTREARVALRPAASPSKSTTTVGAKRLSSFACAGGERGAERRDDVVDARARGGDRRRSCPRPAPRSPCCRIALPAPGAGRRGARPCVDRATPGC